MSLRVLPESPRRGFGLLEVMIALSVFLIGIGAIIVNLVTGMALRESARELSIATEAAQDRMELLRGEDLERVFASFNVPVADDPDGPGTAPGPGFAVPGLEPQTGDADGLAGEVLFPGDGATLREDVVDAALGMPRDLNGDGAVDALDHALDYDVIPVRVRIAWRGRGGDREIEILTSLTNL